MAKIKGLTGAEAQKRLEEGGYNELPQEKSRQFWGVLRDVFKEPMLVLLLVCTIIYIFLGDTREALILLGSIIIIIAITVIQENKTEKALAALKNLSSPRALVLRDGEHQKIPGREVVRGDIVFLNEGDRVPADGTVLENNNLSVDESLLTGESLAVKKKIGDPEEPLDRPGGRESAFVYSGTLVISGQATVLVKTTGVATEMGRIGSLLGGIKEEKTLLQIDVARIVKVIFLVSIFLCLLALGLTVASSGHWLDGLLAGLTLAMAILPEELPIVLVIFTSIGAWRLSKSKILVRRLSAVENLGAASVLCVDKTGTLTMNEMKVAAMVSSDKKGILNELVLDKKNKDAVNLIKFSALASRRETFDPLEKAIRDLRRKLCRNENIYQDLSYRREYPLTSGLFVVAHAWEKEKGGFTVYAKGAPEAIMDICHLTERVRNEIEAEIKHLAENGLRILGVATVNSTKVLTEDVREFKWNFAGLIGFADPVRPGVAEAIMECYDAGIEVKVITGDYSETGLNVARQIGLKNSAKAMTGSGLDQLAAGSLAEEISRTSVFARMVPENKLQIIRALKETGALVAMTGDGVNDGPALKAADIGVSMGKRGTDVAREASDIVLMDDDFPSLVKGIKGGRRIFDNLRRAAFYLVAIHIPIAGLSLLPLFFGWPIIFTPVHIMFMELIIDPICSVVFEAEEADKDIMRRRPRRRNSSILGGRSLFTALIQGFIVLIITGTVYGYTLAIGWEEAAARTITFSTLIFANLLLVLANRSWTLNFFQSMAKHNKALWPIISACFVFLFLAIYLPYAQDVFGFSKLSIKSIGISFGVALISIVMFEVMKFSQRQKLT